MRILVEGASDVAALETLAARLDVEVDVTSVQGVHNFRAHLSRLGPDARPRGLVDHNETPVLLRALRSSGFGEVSEAGLGAIGFFVCDADLEDELLRAVGTLRALEAIEANGEADALRKMQRQRAWRDRPLHEQLRRFIGVKSGRKVRYARLLSTVVDRSRVPEPLLAVLEAT